VRASRSAATQAALLLSVAVGVFGAVYGLQAVDAGLSVAQTCAMSVFVFTGASQVTAVSVINTGGSELAAFGSALLLAARNGVYGVAIAPLLPGSLRRRLLAAHFVLDESTAMATAQNQPEEQVRVFWLVGLGVFICWNTGTLLGALGGSLIDDPLALGLDAMFPATFVVLLAAHLRTRAGRLAAGLGALIAAALVPLTPAGVPLLAAASACLVGLRARRGLDERR
jgi:4-azaleucine resistance transporter AzlC